MAVLEAHKKPEPKAAEAVLEQEVSWFCPTRSDKQPEVSALRSFLLMFQSEPAPNPETPVMEPGEPDPRHQQEAVLLKEEEEPMEQEEAEPTSLDGTLDSVSQVGSADYPENGPSTN